jgi:hypothetical protein
MVAHPMVEIAVGGTHLCARDAEGRVYCWGNDLAGQTGVRAPGGSCTVEVPTEVALPRPAVEIRAANDSTCARLDDGSGYCWGGGHAGAGTTSPPSTCVLEGAIEPRLDPASLDPVPVVPSAPPLTWISLATGDDIRAGLSSDGAPYHWGRYGAGPEMRLPERVGGAARAFVELRAYDQFVLARTATGDLYRWSSSSPVVPELPFARGARVITAGPGMWCWSYADDRIECAGNSERTEWPIGPAGGRLVPRIDSGAITSIAVNQPLAPMNVCWTNAALELWCSFAPATPIALGGTSTEVLSVAQSDLHFVALDAAGRMWSWYEVGASSAATTVLP